MVVEEVVKMAGNKLKNEASHNEVFARATEKKNLQREVSEEY